MPKKFTLLVLIIAAGLLVFLVHASWKPSKPKIYRLSHKVGECPPNTKTVTAIFHEKDGSTRDGCLSLLDRWDYDLDALYPGESCCFSHEEKREPQIEDHD